jgi:hypothetical protein
MANINSVLARVFVPDLDAAIPLYQALAQVSEVSRFSFRDVELAQAGPFLSLAENTGAYRDRVATILVEQLPPVIAALEAAGAQIIEGPSPAPNGDRLIARHPDGSVFESTSGQAPSKGLAVVAMRARPRRHPGPAGSRAVRERPGWSACRVQSGRPAERYRMTRQNGCPAGSR